MDAITASMVLRVWQVVVEATPFLLAGLITAGVFRRLLGADGVRKLFGHGTWQALPRAWALGMLLPVCSLGVIPVVRELRRAGLSGGTVLAFALTAPLFNPLSVLYGLTLAEPMTVLTFALVSLVLVTISGIVFDRVFATTDQPTPPDPTVPQGWRRMAAMGLAVLREAGGPAMLYVLLALIGVASMSAILPHGALQRSVNHGDPMAAIRMTAVAPWVYASPLTAMAQLGSMFQHGNSIAAGFALLTLGAGVNVGLLVWIVKQYGILRSFAWFAILLMTILGFGYALEVPLYPTEVEPADHTHAFDIYTCAYQPGSNAWKQLPQSLADVGSAEVRRPVYVLLALIAAGVALRLAERRYGSLDRKLAATEQAESRAKPSVGRYDAEAPGWLVAGVLLSALVGISVLGCYVYYPAPETCLKEITYAKVEVLSGVSSGDSKRVEYWIPIWEDWNRRLQVGTYLRYGGLPNYHRAKSNVVRDLLEELDHAVEDGETARAKRIATALAFAARRQHEAFQSELTPER